MGVIIQWIDAAGRILNSGTGQAVANEAGLAYEQMLNYLGWAYVIAMGAYLMSGSAADGATYPTQITYLLDDGRSFTMSFAWSCGWDPGGSGGYPPPI